MRRLGLLLLFAPVLHAADDRLAAIHTLLVPMRTAPIGEARGATPALTEVKHRLRDWIESHFAAVQWKEGRWTTDPTVLQEQLNGELSRVDLVCPLYAKCPGNPLGYLGRVTLEIQTGFLLVRTSVGVQVCGTDDSAYIYEWKEDRWRRIWQSEQDDYEEKKYFPQRLVDVKISPVDWLPHHDRTAHLIVTTGVLPWCSSVWQPVYYRVWRIKDNVPNPLLLLDETDQADIAEPTHARVSENDVFVEYQVIADDAMRVSEFRHYVLENGKLRLNDPVALTPGDFVSFWLRHPWADASEWTIPTARANLREWRQRYKGKNSEFATPTRHCALHPDLWQVATDPDGSLNTDVYYFLVRARPPSRFTMVGASERPWPDCTEDDPAIDAAPDFFDK
jgi:hypothetical protein